MSAELIALTQCAECGELWQPVDEDRRKAYLDTEDELVFDCPECAERSSAMVENQARQSDVMSDER